MTAVKVIKVLGTSEDSWQDASEEAFREASKTVDNISGIEEVERSATVEDGNIAEYHSTVEIAFPVEEEA